MEFISKSLAQTEEFAVKFISGLKPNGNGATTVALSGDLGSGKTTFVQACAKSLGVAEKITSPTFVIIKTYKLQTKNYKLLCHIDAYRLKSGEELEKLRFKELLADKNNLIFIEWPENVAGILPEDSIEIRFSFLDQNSRKIETKAS